jgi:hypothetical protein
MIGTKLYPKDSNGMFSLNRTLGVRAKPRMAFLKSDAAGKVGMGMKVLPNQSASDVTRGRRIANFAQTTDKSATGEKTVQNNIVRSHLRRSRSSGAVAPAKKGALERKH